MGWKRVDSTDRNTETEFGDAHADLIYPACFPFGKYLKYVVLLLALGFIVFGVYRGEAAVVLKKAAAICLECCGIG